VNAVFSLIEQLVALGRPTIIGLQSLLGVTLSPVSDTNQYWSLFEAHQPSGLVASVDFREAVGGASNHEPLLVVTLRDAPVRLQDLSHKYGSGRITDMSHHHPSFVGYTYVVHGRQVAFRIDAKSESVLGFSIDYSIAAGGSNKPAQ
jgi:hypothetical protein